MNRVPSSNARSGTTGRSTFARWTVTLLFIAIYQMDAWAAAKMRPPEIPFTCEVTGRQFNWDFRYPGPSSEATCAVSCSEPCSWPPCSWPPS